MHSLAFAVLPLLFCSWSTQDTALPTTLHFFPRKSLSYNTVPDLNTDSTCHTTPTGPEVLYVDGVAQGYVVMPYSDSACSESALLSQSPILAGTCCFYGKGKTIGAWMGICGDEANASIVTSTLSDSSSSSTAFSTMTAPANTSMITTTVTSLTIGSATITTGGELASQTKTLDLQSSWAATSGVVSLHEDDWIKKVAFKALLMMGCAEVPV